ncbi:MAG: tRNA (N(6)-L-threonylcarbamoyladenosine(37)-C(2))-methylthiotransferase MtaB, partial [Thermotogaceae bacterium]|nr:tRNA (N(6)-L-threonylcarbamoyladenosine(37)-C(2))-methylthiotransferase MtaB [Thermotogaceae bacterium]
DIIVGFPGETERDFLESAEAVEKVRFSRVHAFRYSKRSGTPAALMKDQIPGNVKRNRITYLENVAKEVAKEYRKELVGKTVEVLVENKKLGFYHGYDQYYIYHEMVSGETGELKSMKIVHVTDEGVISVEANN